MTTKSDFTEPEWQALEKGITGSALLVSLSDRDLSDTFGEVGAMAKYLAGQQVAASSELMRVLAKTHGTGFGLTASPERMRTETMEALRSSVATLEAKAPTEVEPYRQLVLGVAEAVADAKGGRGAVEAAVIEQISEGLKTAG
jgi:tellurite resistance protein